MSVHECFPVNSANHASSLKPASASINPFTCFLQAHVVKPQSYSGTSSVAWSRITATPKEVYSGPVRMSCELFVHPCSAMQRRTPVGPFMLMLKTLALVLAYIKMQFCRLTCSFNITGKSANAPSNSDTGSNLQNAAIECTGGTLYFVGGPALQHFNDSFKGVSCQCLIMS